MGRISWHGAKTPTRTHSPLAVHIGGKILKLRNKKQISMRYAADHCNLSLAFFCDMENGKTLPGADTLLKMSKAFGVSVNYWFAGFTDG